MSDDAFTRQLIRAELVDADDLDAGNDLEYLIGLIGEAIDETRKFDNDKERSRWVVAQWCQEVGYHPDLSDYNTGQTVPVGTVPEHRERCWQTTIQEASHD